MGGAINPLMLCTQTLYLSLSQWYLWRLLPCRMWYHASAIGVPTFQKNPMIPS